MAATKTAPAAAATDRLKQNRALVRTWLYLILLMLFALFIVGGATRLTDSGLSITEWQPIHGAIPPLTEAEWQEEFDKYRQIPEYQQINRGMSLDAFKTIFWWEWAHRLLARGVGVAMALPLAFFWLAGRLENHLKPKLLGLLAMGGLQGFVGWWMVSSGLTQRVDVSQYRLATHLLLACIIFTAVMWVARGLASHSEPPAGRATRRVAGTIVLLVLVQIGLGALVAGLDAGMAFNDWPLMDGAVLPGGLLAQQPWWVNFFENPKTVQFVHRIGAYVLLVAAFAQAFFLSRWEPETLHARRAEVLLFLVLAQAALGVTALMLVVPFGWALAHHAFAIVTLGFAVAHWRGTAGEYPVPDR